MKRFTITSEDQWYCIPSEREAHFRRFIGEKRKGRVFNTGFFVNDSEEIRLVGKFLKQDIVAFYNSDYRSAGAWSIPGTIENMIWTLKNDVDPFPDRLALAKQQLSNILSIDLPLIKGVLNKPNLTICIVPRSKAENYYTNDQLFFKQVISAVVSNLSHFENGSNYLIRHSNTRTTHLDRNGEGGDGNLPYPGITVDTCTISERVTGKDILLIDDLYTKTVNIDEDAIQSLIDKGANSVSFYSIGKTLAQN